MPSIWGPRYVNEFASQLPEGLRVRVLGCKSVTSQRVAFLLLLFFAVFLLILFVLVALFDFLIKKKKPLFLRVFGSTTKFGRNRVSHIPRAPTPALGPSFRHRPQPMWSFVTAGESTRPPWHLKSLVYSRVHSGCVVLLKTFHSHFSGVWEGEKAGVTQNPPSVPEVTSFFN